MADDPVIHAFDLPRGRRLKDGPAGNVLGSFGGNPKATPQLLAALRRADFPEIAMADLQHQRKRRWLNVKTGEELEHIRGVDPHAPADGVTSFAVVDNDSVMFLRPVAALTRRESVTVGTVGGWRA